MSKVSIVVLGDVGRSPRMQYHAMSLADEGYSVTVIGYEGSKPVQSLLDHDKISFKYLLNCPDFKQNFAGFFAYILKTVWQSWTLMLGLLFSSFPDFLLIQNPPAIPALVVCYCFCRVLGIKLIIDWHNYSHTILALSLHEEHRLVRMTKWIEFGIGKRSDANFCVTRAMKSDLELRGINAVTLYDRPPEQFQPISLEAKHELIERLAESYSLFTESCGKGETVFTRMGEDGKICSKDSRPGLLISSTSWTEDEDFSMLLDALQVYETACVVGSELPQLIVAITGKGPLKEFYWEIILKRKWENVKVITPWLTAEDYPKFLACGDLGVCLHTSSSGLDLPMKVVDMFGSGLPVAAVKFKCLDELVRHRENGFIFEDAHQLSNQLQDWFTNFPDSCGQTFRADIHKNVQHFQALRWRENWLFNAKRIFQ